MLLPNCEEDSLSHTVLLLLLPHLPHFPCSPQGDYRSFTNCFAWTNKTMARTKSCIFSAMTTLNHQFIRTVSVFCGKLTHPHIFLRQLFFRSLAVPRHQAFISKELGRLTTFLVLSYFDGAR